MSILKKDRVFNPNDYVPKRFGLNYNPPQIIIEYLTPSTGKLYHHKMRLHKFTKEKNTTQALTELYDRHPLYLSKNKINTNQMIKLIEKLKSNLKPAKNKPKDNKENSKEQEISIRKVEKIVEPEPKPKEIKQVEEKKEEEEDEDDEYNFDEFNDEDLNKLDDEALNEKKSQMDKFYEKNSIKVGDSNFEYDVRKDFNHDEFAAEWDDDSY